MIRFCSLGSGSTGNGTLVEGSAGITTTRVLVDCGFTQRELVARLARAQLEPRDIDAIFVTHEHSDHVGCAVGFARKHGIALYMSRGTWRAIGQPELGSQIRFARDGDAIDLGDLQLSPYTVPHDAAEPLQPRVTDGGFCLGVLTDAGSMTDHMLDHLRGCDALLLECNHDKEMLQNSRYPWPLKQRIGGRFGHLSNDTAAQILASCLHTGLRHVVAAHLSRENNRPELALAALAKVAGADMCDMRAAGPQWGFDWIELR